MENVAKVTLGSENGEHRGEDDQSVDDGEGECQLNHDAEFVQDVDFGEEEERYCNKCSCGTGENGYSNVLVD